MRVAVFRRIEAGDRYLQSVSTGWGEALRQALDALPDYEMDPGADGGSDGQRIAAV